MNRVYSFGTLAVGVVVAATLAASGNARAGTLGAGGPIQHVVIILQENHSFDNVLGLWCVQTHRCNGTNVATLSNGDSYLLTQAPDIVPIVQHGVHSQQLAMNGGMMDGFDLINGCTSQAHYACLSQYAPGQIPNLTNLADAFAVSDATFESNAVPSWGSHLEFVAGDLDGFTGDNPLGKGQGPGWGCDSDLLAPWQASVGAPIRDVPSCVPDYALNSTEYPFGGAFEATPVQWEPTIMDEAESAGVTWKIYSTNKAKTGIPYGWAICPTFADCIDTNQAKNMVPSTNILTAAQTGTLPNIALVTPSAPNSQHNGWSMVEGDNWIGRVVGALMDGPEWSSTAVEITYDDCGCFYDHVSPPSGLGIRVPVVWVSPWVKPGYTDSTTATLGSSLAFIEHNFGLPCMGTADCAVYDYSNVFSFPTDRAKSPALRAPAPGFEGTFTDEAHPTMVVTRVPRWEINHLRRFPPPHEAT